MTEDGCMENMPEELDAYSPSAISPNPDAEAPARSLTATLTSWWSHVSFRRIVTSNRFIPEVDGFRFLAIGIVIISHIFVQCGPLPGNGWFMHWVRFNLAGSDPGHRGVYLFFTISGFILAMPFARHHLQGGKKVKLGSYFRRRITRLEPPYILALLLRFPLVYLVKRTAIVALALHLLASLLYVHNIVYAEYSTINPPAWSLEVEIQFYILAPLLSAIFLIRRKHLRRACMVAAMLVGGFLSFHLGDRPGILPLTLLAFSQYFFAGFLLCDFYLTGDVWKLKPWVWDLLGVAALAWIILTHVPWYPIAFPFFTIALYMAGFYGSAVRAVFAFRPFSLIGGMCYSLYLTHTTVLTVVSHITPRLFRSSLPVGLQLGLTFGMSFAGILLVGAGYFLLIERPCMDPAWPHKLALRLGWRSA
jgi:peptidoglycan/LPS O-acetylase OafA/YrhL